MDLVGRLTLVLPYDKSIPRSDVQGDTLTQFLRLRDVDFFIIRCILFPTFNQKSRTRKSGLR